MDYKDPAPVFSIQKKHAWRDQLIKIISLVLIAAVVVGTTVWVFASSRFSFSEAGKKVVQTLSPKIATSEEKIKSLSKEDQLKKLIEEESVLEIDSITKTAEGDLSLKAKSGQIIIFAVSKDLSSQVRTLQTLLSKARIENKAFKKVDFRFEKVVVEH